MGEFDWVNNDKNNYGKASGSILSSSSLIKVGGTNFASMQDASAIDSLKASVPPAHREFDYKLRVQSQMAIPRKLPTLPNSIKEFKRGAPVIHRETGKKLTIIHASVGYTKRTKTPVHRVADKDGNVWDIKESKLQLRV